MNLTETLYSEKLILPPKWLPSSVQYECIMGSQAYGTNTEESDTDIYGWCIPPRNYIFPHLAGEIAGFDDPQYRFDHFQAHHLQYKEKEYDVQIYSIVKYFRLLTDNNPNIVDSIYVPQNCVIKQSPIAYMVREKRDIFLSKKAYHKLLGYSWSQLHKMQSKDPSGKRKEIREKYGYDVKFGAHVVRLLSQCQQMLEEGTLDLQEVGRREHMKAIRRGEVPQEDIVSWFNSKEKELQKIYNESKLQYSPDVAQIKQLLLDCLEHHYGSLSKVIEVPDKYKNIITQIQTLLSTI